MQLGYHKFLWSQDTFASLGAFFLAPHPKTHRKSNLECVATEPFLIRLWDPGVTADDLVPDIPV